MRRALVVGIDEYKNASLVGCVNDANKIAKLLTKNEDNSPNFECITLTAPKEQVTRTVLRENLQMLFRDKADVALFYFSGHGTLNALGGYVVTQDAKRNDEGVSMAEILSLANQSPVREVVIIIDSCHSGAFGEIPGVKEGYSLLREGMSVLTASRKYQDAIEDQGEGLFTSQILFALEGGASDVLGKVTVASVYAYVDETFGAWGQRPLLKSNVSTLFSLRQCAPIVELPVLRLLPTYFPTVGFEFKLDPSYEPTAEPKDPEHEKSFGHLQRFRAARLLVPIGEEHLYYAAMNRKSCKLTPLGRFYWTLVANGRV